MAYQIYTKEMICCIIVIYIGFLTTLSHSTTVNALTDSIQTSEQNDPMENHRKQFKIDDSIDDAKHLDIFDDSDDDFESIEVDDELTLKDQLRMLAKQMNKRFQHQLKTTIRKAAQELLKTDLQSQIEQLRHEIKALKKSRHVNAINTSDILHSTSNNGNKERLTIDWFAKVVTEFRTELSELQEAQSNVTRRLQQRNQCAEEMVELRDDFDKLKLEWNAVHLRQNNLDHAIKDLQTEAIQRDDDFRRSQLQNPKAPGTIDFIKPDADHRLRHQRFVRQHLHDLAVVQKTMKRQLNELHHHRIGDRLHNLEVEQKRLANANFNMSRQVASLDRLHGSMLELLEDIESIQNKFDKTIPDIKREISKVEFNAAQVASEYNLLREEGHNAAKSIQALAVSVSTLQDDRDMIKQLEQTVNDLKCNMTNLQNGANAHRHIFHKRIEKMESDSKLNAASTERNVANKIQIASKLVQQLETVEQQYESIINKLPADCSQIEDTGSGLFMIAPSGQQHPILANCMNHWTTIQRRHDGSVDFNRSWDEYSQGFGTPSGEYWIGNTILNHLTADNCTTLKIIMQDIYDNTWEAIYGTFSVGSREDGYRLSISGYTGNASDAFQYQNDMQFSAIDVDRDISNTHCAGNYEGGWWFSHCQHANLNGRYNLGLTWFDATRNEWIAVKSSHMMISKRSNCGQPYAMDTQNAFDTNRKIYSSTNAAPATVHSIPTTAPSANSNNRHPA